MICTYQRGGGLAQPPDYELLEVEDDGNFRMWRSVGWATVPPTPVGLFGGSIETADLVRLRQECAAASRAGDLSMRMQPGIPVESIEIEGATAELTPGPTIPGDWGPLVEHLRGLLASLTQQPRAALALELGPGRETAQLVQLGGEPLRLELGAVSILVSQQTAGGGDLGEWRLPAADLGGEVAAGPGWSLALPFDHGLRAAPGSRLTAIVNLVVYDEDGLDIPVSLAASIEE